MGIMGRSSKFFALFSIILLLFISESALIVHAQVLTKDYGETNLYDSKGSVFCTIDITATIQTEPNGHWIQNKTYSVNWTIAITYVNQSIYNSSDFFITFSNPASPVYDSVENPPAWQDTLTVTPEHSETMSVTERPLSAGTSEFHSSFSWNAFTAKYNVEFGAWKPSSNTPKLYITVEPNQTLPITTPTPKASHESTTIYLDPSNPKSAAFKVSLNQSEVLQFRFWSQFSVMYLVQGPTGKQIEAPKIAWFSSYGDWNTIVANSSGVYAVVFVIDNNNLAPEPNIVSIDYYVDYPKPIESFPPNSTAIIILALTVLAAIPLIQRRSKSKNKTLERESLSPDLLSTRHSSL